MNNHFEFNYHEDKDSFKYFYYLSNDSLNTYLDMSFTYIEDYLNYFANIFKIIFNDSDCDEFYYTCKSLIEELNDIKIILNILKEREIDE